MIDKFMKMTETLEHIAKNKFRPVAEKELKEFIKNIVEEVLLEKQGKIYGMFDVWEENLWRKKNDEACK